MKTPLLLFCALIAHTVSSQTIRIADNTPTRPGGPNIYATLQAAIDAATPGDIVYIQPSATNYGSVTIGKQITLQGVGFGITELGDRSSSIGSITLLSSADGLSSVSNSVFKGFSFDQFLFAVGGFGTFTYDNIIIENISGRFITTSGATASIHAVNNLIVRNCMVNGIYLPMTNANVRIYNNVLNSEIGGDNLNFSFSTNPLISNNFFYRVSRNGADQSCISLDNSTGIRIENNLFSGTQAAFRTLLNANVVNNIFYSLSPGSILTNVVFKDNIFSNNLVAPISTIPPTGNFGGINTGQNNLNGVSPGL
ncbi:MAG: hypothetical protein WDN75_07830 [Bacteroidota bacterium]